LKPLTQLIRELQKFCATPGTIKVLRYLSGMLKWAVLLALIVLLWKITSLLGALLT
jgi:hypothetical protein